MKNEFDIYEELNVREDLIKDQEWKYIQGDSNPRIFYRIDTYTIINVEFSGYNSLSNGIRITNDKREPKKMIVKMIKNFDTIFEKKINHFSKDYFLVRKMRKIIKGMEHARMCTVREKDEERRMLKEKNETEEKRKKYLRNMAKVPTHYIREKKINEILED